MKWYNADLHIHSVLSPCGDLEMSPNSVMQMCLQKNLDIIAITDHNSMANCLAYKKVAFRYGITLLYGIEVQTSEEAHLIVLFDEWEQADGFNQELYASLLPLMNDPDYFGDQVVVNNEEEIVRFEEKALINSSVWSLDEMIDKINSYGGFYFPAHEDAATYSIIAQLGFLPEYIDFPAVGITAKCNLEKLFTNYPYLKKYTLLRNSDAHYLKDIASGYSRFFISEPTVKEIALACQNMGERKILIDN